MASSMTQKIYDSLKSEYNRKENELKSVDKDLKKLTGGTGNDLLFDKSSSSIVRKVGGSGGGGSSRFDDKRYPSSSSNRSSDMNRKRRISDSGSRIFSRLDKRLDDGKTSSHSSSHHQQRPSLQSAVVSAANSHNEVKEENLIQENTKPDKKSVARNRRMFGMIMGTLQKFQNEESQRKVVTTKREEIEKKLDKADAEEKEAVKQEKLSLIKSKRDKQTQLKDIETKMDRVEIHQQWEKSNQHLTNFIQTKTKPHLFYMPKTHTPETERRQKETKNKYLIILAEKRAKIQKEIEDLNKRDEEIKIKEEKLKNGDDNYDRNSVRNGKEQLNNNNNNNSSTEVSKESKLNKETRDDKELKEIKKQKMYNNEDYEDGECDSNDLITDQHVEQQSSKTTIDHEKLQNTNSNESSNHHEETNQSNESKANDEIQSNLNEKLANSDNNQSTDETNNLDQSNNQQSTIVKQSDDKEFEPIYDE